MYYVCVGGIYRVFYLLSRGQRKKREMPEHTGLNFLEFRMLDYGVVFLDFSLLDFLHVDTTLVRVRQAVLTAKR